MGEWKEIRLRDVCTDISYGYTASATDKDTGYKFLRITDIVNSPFSWDSVPFCEINEKDSKKYHLSPGDIVIARTGATTGTTYTVKDETNAVYASYLIKYQIDRTQADPFFIGYCLRSDNWKGYVENIIGGSAQPGANAQQFADYEISLPSITEQQTIAEVLSSLDDKIELLHRQNKTLEQMAETLFRQWFVDSKEESTIREEFNVIMGQSPPGDSYNEIKEGILFFQGCTDFGFRFPEPRIYCTSPTRYADKLDTLMSVRAPVGDLNYAEEKCCIGRGLAAIRHKNKNLHHSYAYYILKYLKSDFDIHEDSGTIFGSINKDELLNIKCSKIEEGRIDFYNNEIGTLDDKIVMSCKQIKTLENLRNSLLPKLMNGSIRVINN